MVCIRALWREPIPAPEGVQDWSILSASGTGKRGGVEIHACFACSSYSLCTGLQTAGELTAAEVRTAGGASATQGERCRTMVAFRCVNVPVYACTLYIQWEPV